jgi:hypothetical protein
MLSCTLGISANTDSIRQAKGIQTPIPYKQTNKGIPLASIGKLPFIGKLSIEA